MSDPSEKDDKPEAGHPRNEEFVSLFKRGLKFTEELLEENERLRFRVASLESQGGEGGGTTSSSTDALVLELQAKLIASARRQLKPGGRLIYSVCTFEPEEGTGHGLKPTRSELVFEG